MNTKNICILLMNIIKLRVVQPYQEQGLQRTCVNWPSIQNKDSCATTDITTTFQIITLIHSRRNSQNSQKSELPGPVKSIKQQLDWTQCESCQRYTLKVALPAPFHLFLCQPWSNALDRLTAFLKGLAAQWMYRVCKGGDLGA